MAHDAPVAPTAPAIQRIGQIAVPVKDLDRAVGFYRDVLGLPFLFQAPPGLAFFDCNGVRLMLDAVAEAEHDHPASIIYYQVADIQSSWASVVERGAEVADEPHLIAKMPDHDLWMGFLRDTEGNTLALMCEVRADE